MADDRHDLLGVRVHATRYRDAVDRIVAAARLRQPFGVSALAVHGVMIGATQPAHRTRLNRLELLAPDGQPVRWALNWLHRTGLTDRVYGPFLMKALCERAAEEGLSIYCYGTDAETLTALEKSLKHRYPTLTIAGTRPSRFRRATQEEWEEDVMAIRASQADLVFCGLGCPRQEIWVYEMREYIDAPLVAVGAAFPFLSGRLEMAPAWMQRNGLEWLFRLSREPGRLWWRYLKFNPMFLGGIALQKLGRKAPAHEVEPPAERWS